MATLARFAVILVRPDSAENIGLAARGMANTGFGDLRLVGLEKLEPPAWRTAIHAESILEGAKFFPSLAEALADRELVLGSTARVRHDFPLVPLAEAVVRVAEYPAAARVGFVFGNERTGLTQDELGLANVRFHIPQAARQPSYNLGVAVTLTLHAIAFRGGSPPVLRRDLPLDHAAQAEAGRRFRDMLDALGFMHDTNRAFIEEKVQDIFFRMALTAKDRDVMLAMFRKALEGPRAKRPRPRKQERSPHES
jgi:tRNA/rRNA methyltransferase